MAMLLVGIAVAVVALAPSVDAENFWSEVPRALLTLAAGVIVAGGVASLLAAHNRAVDQRRSDHDQRLELVAELRETHNAVKTAALLINAHQSVRTYGQQAQGLIAARVQLLDVDWAARSRPRLCGGDEAVELMSAFLRRASEYLEAVIEEYGAQYGRVAAIQLASSKWNDRAADDAAQNSSPPDPGGIVVSTVPWAELCKPDVFPRLADLRLDTEAHRKGFSAPVNEAIGILVQQDEIR
ncbi:hypothetical protein [Geodermatophilus sp. CPCC 205761]|uniref:hypothetical protein n=1 Tax=Geodermatophilus sp. CPCC 205761 TaxID=2936597 RepID=UPI003EEE1F8B